MRDEITLRHYSPTAFLKIPPQYAAIHVGSSPTGSSDAIPSLITCRFERMRQLNRAMSASSAVLDLGQIVTSSNLSLPLSLFRWFHIQLSVGGPGDICTLTAITHNREARAGEGFNVSKLSCSSM